MRPPAPAQPIGNHDALLHPAAPILLRYRPARQDHLVVRLRERRQRNFPGAEDVVAHEFLAGDVVVQRVAGRQLSGAATVVPEDGAPDRLALRVADVDPELTGLEPAVPDDARRQVGAEGEQADHGDGPGTDLRPAPQADSLAALVIMLTDAP